MTIKVDIISFLGIEYIANNPKEKPKYTQEFYPKLHKTHVTTMNDYVSRLKEFSELIKQNPKLTLKNFSYYNEEYKPINLSDKTLNELITKEEVMQLHAFYLKQNESHEKAAKASLEEKRARYKEAYELYTPEIKRIDCLTHGLLEHIIRQEVTNTLKSQEQICNVLIKNNELRIALDNGCENQGHGKYLFEIYDIINETKPITKNQLTIKTIEIRLKQTKKGYTDYEFEKEFYK